MNDIIEEKSRTQRKNEVTKLQEIGEKLILLTTKQLYCIDIPQELIDAIIHVKTISSNQAKRRQKQYIGALMRKIEIEPVQKALQQIEDGIALQNKEPDKFQLWQKALIEGDDSPINEILHAFPDTDQQQFRQLIRNARKEKTSAKSKKTASNLLNHLKKIAR